MRPWERPLGSELVTQPCRRRFSLHIYGISQVFPSLVTAICHALCNTAISWVDWEVAGTVQGQARSLWNNQFYVPSSSEDNLGMLNLTFMENNVENASFFPAKWCPEEGSLQNIQEVKCCLILLCIILSSLVRLWRMRIRDWQRGLTGKD